MHQFPIISASDDKLPESVDVVGCIADVSASHRDKRDV
jgi:hypothetical protein